MDIIKKAKSKFIKSAVISGAISIVCIVAAFLASSTGGDIDQQIMMMNAQRAGMEAGNAQALERYRLGQENQKIMAQLNPSNDPLYGTMDRKKSTLILDQLNKKYQLSGLNLNISPAAFKTEAPYTRKTGGVNVSTVSITFNSITDEFAFAFLRDIIASFPGFKRLTGVNLTKKDVINEDILYAVHNGEIPPKVEGVIAFDWLGLEVKEENAAQTPQP